MPTGTRGFSRLQNVQVGPGAHPASYSMGTRGGLSQGVKRPGLEFDDSSLSSAEVKNKCGYTSTPRYKLHGLGRDFTFF